MRRILIPLAFVGAALLGAALAADLPSHGTVTIVADDGTLVGAGSVEPGKLELDLLSGANGFVTLTVTAADGTAMTYDAFLGQDGQLKLTVNGEIVTVDAFAAQNQLALELGMEDHVSSPTVGDGGMPGDPMGSDAGANDVGDDHGNDASNDPSNEEADVGDDHGGSGSQAGDAASGSGSNGSDDQHQGEDDASGGHDDGGPSGSGSGGGDD